MTLPIKRFGHISPKAIFDMNQKFEVTTLEEVAKTVALCMICDPYVQLFSQIFLSFDYDLSEIGTGRDDVWRVDFTVTKLDSHPTNNQAKGETA